MSTIAIGVTIATVVIALQIMACETMRSPVPLRWATVGRVLGGEGLFSLLV